MAYVFECAYYFEVCFRVRFAEIRLERCGNIIFVGCEDFSQSTEGGYALLERLENAGVVGRT